MRSRSYQEIDERREVSVKNRIKGYILLSMLSYFYLPLPDLRWGWRAAGTMLASTEGGDLAMSRCSLRSRLGGRGRRGGICPRSQAGATLRDPAEWEQTALQLFCPNQEVEISNYVLKTNTTT